MTAETVPILPAPEGWTIADIDALPENGLRYELVDGVPRVMNPPRKNHQQVARRLAFALENVAPADVEIVEAVGVVLAEDNRPIPDVLALVAGQDDEESNFPATGVLLVAEIVSPSSRSDDRFRKPAQYAQAGIGVYLRVELDPPHVVAYAIGEDGLYVETARAEPGELLTLTEPFAFGLDPATLLR
ncbi:MAG: Uma2 family endonuclease [Pseudonocardia sp.]|nr:Uma2 family endonuclease [Pseudonocardia sp.]